MSKVAKGVVKVMKKIVKGVKKVFKKVWESPIGKIIVIAAAIYTGGLALGAWGAAGAAGAGTAGSTVGSLAAAETVGTAAATGAMSGTVAATGGAVAGTAANAAQAGTVAETAGSLAAAETVGTTAATSAMASAPAVTAPSFLSTAGDALGNMGSTAMEFGKDVATYAGEHELLASTALQGLGAALTPTPGEEAEALAQADEQRRKDRWGTLSEASEIDINKIFKSSRAKTGTGYLQRT